MSFYVNSIREGLNLLFPVPVARLAWSRHGEVSSQMQERLRQIEIGPVPGNRLKLEGSDDLSSASDPAFRDLFAFMLDRAGDMSHALLGMALTEAFSATRKASRSAFRDTKVTHFGNDAGEREPRCVRLKIIRSWVNVYEAGHFHGPHSHPGALLAAIYAVSIPGDTRAPQGSVAFQDPRREAVNHLAALKFTGEGADAYCHLHAGDLLIFPGWLTHYVVPHQCSSSRVTISANIGLEEVDDGQ